MGCLGVHLLDRAWTWQQQYRRPGGGAAEILHIVTDTGLQPSGLPGRLSEPLVALMDRAMG